jgi:hypothetical protein
VHLVMPVPPELMAAQGQLDKQEHRDKMVLQATQVQQDK